MSEDFETSAEKNQLIGNKQFVVYIKIIQKCMCILTETLMAAVQMHRFINLKKAYYTHNKFYT